ncbi:hypothetical protein EHI47_08085 [Rhizobium leguminosarum]|uniref:Uncharacterized protein n=2 Tax=Rhizobium TaxID=379 RepID=A0A444I6L9_RHILE|nr:hypothetical protein EHI45_26320 [Rhizobium leguminosarum]TBE58349.1 hypothetical protein ELH03_35635 [Rhizobium beringeri]RWX33955.1 hypothetical protein EHI47_08085 [Rhizobium leguminosarum]TAU37901.1 hypothetical protein ELI43_31475 [Rhizobium leguminosarum]TBC54819.1 hypothetical protein ELH27_35480 [Rhizobium leguminosarum]
MVVSKLSANFRSADTAKLSTKRVSAPDPEHPFQTHFREYPLTLGTDGARAANLTIVRRYRQFVGAPCVRWGCP